MLKNNRVKPQAEGKPVNYWQMCKQDSNPGLSFQEFCLRSATNDTATELI